MLYTDPFGYPSLNLCVGNGVRALRLSPDISDLRLEFGGGINKDCVGTWSRVYR